MTRTFKEAIEHRRSIYGLTKKIPLNDAQLEDLVKTALLHTPSAFNSQSTRIVLLIGAQHEALWDIVQSALEKATTPEKAAEAKKKIDGAFRSGYGTVLFFEDTEAVKALQKNFPSYAERFPVWSQHTNAMHQFVVWNFLEDAGMGASLQHYNPLIDHAVAKHWHLPPSWELVAQMPFGGPAAQPGEKTFEPTEKRLKVFK